MAGLWQSRIRQASYRGVPFGVADAGLEAGRRAVVHEFPQRELPYVEDMGAAPDRFTLQAFVLGSDYMTRRDRLEAELKKPGSGVLVHPWYGELEVAQFAPYRVRHSAQDGGMAVFELSFCRQGAPSSPAASLNQGLRALLRADLAGGLACEAFDDVLRLAGEAEYVVSQTWDMVSEAVTTVQAVLGGDVHAIAEVLGAATGYDLLGAVSLGERLWGVYQDLAARLTPMQAAGRWAEAARMPSAVPDPPHAGSMRRTIRANGLAIADLTRRIAVAEACKAAASAVPPSRAAAASLRDAMVDALDAAETMVGIHSVDPELETRISEALAEARGASLAALAEAARTAPEVRAVTPAAVMPSLALCYRYSGGVALEADLVARNGIAHPGFAPARALEVLTQ